jgi:predicted RNase H-like nuclease (RuvC/YqgF family)
LLEKNISDNSDKIKNLENEIKRKEKTIRGLEVELENKKGVHNKLRSKIAELRKTITNCALRSPTTCTVPKLDDLEEDNPRPASSKPKVSKSNAIKSINPSRPPIIKSALIGDNE